MVNAGAVRLLLLENNINGATVEQVTNYVKVRIPTLTPGDKKAVQTMFTAMGWKALILPGNSFIVTDK